MNFPILNRSFRNTEITDVPTSEQLTVRYRFFIGSDLCIDTAECSNVCSIMITLLKNNIPIDEIVLFDVGRNVPKAKLLYETLIRNLSLPETALDDFEAWCSLDAVI